MGFYQVVDLCFLVGNLFIGGSITLMSDLQMNAISVFFGWDVTKMFKDKALVAVGYHSLL